MVITSFRCIPQLGLIYLYNPKVACSTILHSLWAAADARAGVKKKIKAHHRMAGPFIENIFEDPLFGTPGLRAMTCFSVVRNPFLRILSGYLNKIVERTPVWRRFAAERGLDAAAAENQISFTDFLHMVETDCDETMNEHFQPQYLNLMLPFSRPHFVGRLENFAEIESFLGGHGVTTIERKGVVTNTSGRLHEFYTAEAEAIVARKFADDFRLFGYSPLVSEVGTLLEPQWPAETTDLLMEWLADKTFPADQLDPAPRAYLQFREEKDRVKRMEIARGIFALDDNTDRLEAYLRKARQYGDPSLAAEIETRIGTLKNAWRERVNGELKSAPPKEKVPRAERRARRREKLDLKRKAASRVRA